MNEAFFGVNEAIFGFLGVLLGACIPWIREELNERRLRRQFAMYLVARVVCVLDEFVEKCTEVVSDDGTIMGRAAVRDENGQEYYEPQVPLPKAPGYPDDIDWKSIDRSLMYRLLALPNNARETDRYISACSEHASAPDYEEVFEARKAGYATLGLEALRLAKELRKTAKMPAKEYGKWNPDWNPEEYFRDVLKKVESIQEKRASSFAGFHSDFIGQGHKNEQ